MKTIPDIDSRTRTASGFSLVELLVVVGIMAVLFLIAAPVVNSLMDSNNLARAGQSLADQVNLGRQTSSSRNRAVELRLIKVSDPNKKKGYTAMQLWMTDATGVSKQLDRAVMLPTGVAVAETKSLSKGLELMTSGTMPADAAVGAGQAYAAFQIRPNGMVLPSQPMKDFFLTVVSIHVADATAYPDNYAMVQVNPLTATPLVYRP